MCALSYSFAVRSDVVLIGQQIDDALADLRDLSGNPVATHTYWVTSAGSDGSVDVGRDGEVLARRQQPGAALGWVMWDVNRRAAEAASGHMLLHSGAMEAAGAGILLPGASGSGKSTLVAGLVGAGLGYLTDELAAVDMRSGLLLPYPKPITVKRGSFGVLSHFGPDARSPSDSVSYSGEEWQVAVGGRTPGVRIGAACTPALVIAPRYAPGAETTLEPLSETQAFFMLAVNAVNLVAHGAAGTDVLGRLARECRCFTLTYSDLEDACGLVVDMAESVMEGTAS